MSNPYQTSYDEVPYESWPFPQTHPDRLATLATLFGMTPAPVARCRVLELGCASGGNLIPMAQTLPESHFVGVDLSARQIADGQAIQQTLGLTNIELRQLSITEVNPDLGEFDYIISHGVYSWVPDAVQEQMLAICERQLAPDGVAYISYNTYPGWRMRGMIRDMMQYHAHMFEPPQRVPQARGLLDFLAQSVPTENNPYGILLKQELEMLRRQPDSYLFHEHLEDVNEPLYFHQFVERAAAHRLQYLGEADFSIMLASNFAPQVAETLRRVAPDIIRMEQYMDFLRNRTFRQTLLVHADRTLRRDLNYQHLNGLLVASPAKPVTELPDLTGPTQERFQAPNGAMLHSANPITKTAMALLAECWPQALPFTELRAAARGRLQPLHIQDAAGVAQDTQLLGMELLQCYTVGIIELRTGQPPFTLTVSDRPLACPLARWQAQRGPRVTNRRHEPTDLNEFSRYLLPLLDGEHDRDALLQALEQLAANGVLVIEQHGKRVAPAEARKLLAEALDHALPLLARSALLLD